jgi:hypothetical protein
MLSGYVLLNQRRNKLSPTISVESVLFGDVHSLKNQSQRISSTLFHTLCKEAIDYRRDRKHRLLKYYADGSDGYRALTLADAIQCVLMRWRGFDPEEHYFWFDAEPVHYWPEMEEHLFLNRFDEAERAEETRRRSMPAERMSPQMRLAVLAAA